MQTVSCIDAFSSARLEELSRWTYDATLPGFFLLNPFPFFFPFLLSFLFPFSFLIPFPFPSKDNAELRVQVSHGFGFGLIPDGHTFGKEVFGGLYVPLFPSVVSTPPPKTNLA